MDKNAGKSLYFRKSHFKRGIIMTLKRIFHAILSKLPIIIGAAVICGLVGGYINYFVLTEEYTATATFYVLSKSLDYDTNEESASYSDIRVSDLLVSDYNALATSKRVKNKVAENVGLSSLTGYNVSVSLSNDTRVMKMIVKGKNPALAAKIANEMVDVFSDFVKEIMNVENVNIVDEATVPKTPSSPKKLNNTILITAAGAILAAGIVVIIELFDNTVKTADDIEENFGVPVLAQVGLFHDEDGESEDNKKKKK